MYVRTAEMLLGPGLIKLAVAQREASWLTTHLIFITASIIILVVQTCAGRHVFGSVIGGKMSS